MERNDLEFKMAEMHDKGFRKGFALGLAIAFLELLIVGLAA